MTWQVFLARAGCHLVAALVVAAVHGWLPSAVPSVHAASSVQDQALRADTIVQMLRFVEWNRVGPGMALKVAVVGNDGLAAALREACASLQPAGRALHVFQVATPQAAAETGAHVVVLGGMPQAEAHLIATRLADRGILTIGAGDCPGTTQLALNLLADGPRYRVAANPTAAARAGVGLSSRLLRLAQIIN